MGRGWSGAGPRGGRWRSMRTVMAATALCVSLLSRQRGVQEQNSVLICGLEKRTKKHIPGMAAPALADYSAILRRLMNVQARGFGGRRRAGPPTLSSSLGFVVEGYKLELDGQKDRRCQRTRTMITERRHRRSAVVDDDQGSRRSPSPVQWTLGRRARLNSRTVRRMGEAVGRE